MDQIFVPQPPTTKFICQNLILNVIVIGGRAFGRWLCHECMELSWMGLVPLWKRPREWSCSFHRERAQYRDGHLWTRKQAQQTQGLLVPLSWTSQPSQLWKSTHILWHVVTALPSDCSSTRFSFFVSVFIFSFVFSLSFFSFLASASQSGRFFNSATFWVRASGFDFQLDYLLGVGTLVSHATNLGFSTVNQGY